jgi:hypothetical protein
MASPPTAVTVLKVNSHTSDDVAVLVHRTAAVLTLRKLNLFKATGDGDGRAQCESNAGDATRADIFDLETGTRLLVSDFGVWNANTSVLEGASAVLPGRASQHTAPPRGDPGDAAEEQRSNRAEAPQYSRTDQQHSAERAPGRKRRATMS